MQKSFRSSFFKYFVTLFLFVIAPAGMLWAHGGHGKPEYQFKILPVKVESPDKVLLKMGSDVQTTRSEFFAYIRNVGAFQMKKDLLQRDFLLHYWIVEGLSRYYPSDINDLMMRQVKIGPESPDFRPRMNEWIDAQADLFACLLHYYHKAKASGYEKDPNIQASLNAFSAHVKQYFLEDLVSFGKMEPTVMGLRQFVVKLPQQSRQNIESQYADPDLAKPFERTEANKRWIQYRRDLVKYSKVEKLYENVKSIDVPLTTPILKVNKHVVTMRDFLAIYGPIPNDVNWNNIKSSRGAQLALALAMADEVDHLGVLPASFSQKINFSHKMYLAVHQIVHELGPKSLNLPNAKPDFEFFRKVVLYTNLIKFEKDFIEMSAKLPELSTLWVDKEYLHKLDWQVKQAFTGEQSTYF